MTKPKLLTPEQSRWLKQRAMELYYLQKPPDDTNVIYRKKTLGGCCVMAIDELTAKLGDDGDYERRLISKTSNEMHLRIEQYIKLHLQPKPRWLPARLWYWLLSKLLVLEMGDLKVWEEK